MDRVEYRIERIPAEEDHESRLLQVVERLNELGSQGWRVASIDLTPHPAFKEAPLPVLLEREVMAEGREGDAAAPGTMT